MNPRSPFLILCFLVGSAMCAAASDGYPSQLSCFDCRQESPESWTVRYSADCGLDSTYYPRQVSVIAPREEGFEAEIVHLRGDVIQNGRVVETFEGNEADLQALGIEQERIFQSRPYRFRGAGVWLITFSESVSLTDTPQAARHLAIRSAEVQFRIAVPDREDPAIPVGFGRQSILRELVINDGSVAAVLAAAPLAAASAPAIFAPATQRHVERHGPSGKFRIESTGLQILDGFALEAAGIALHTVDPSLLQVWIGGESVPFWSSAPAGAPFAHQDVLLFRVEDAETEYQAFRTAWVTLDGPAPARVQDRSIMGATLTHTFSSVPVEQVETRRVEYSDRKRDPSLREQFWYWGVASSTFRYLDIPAPGVAKDSPIALTLRILANGAIAPGATASLRLPLQEDGANRAPVEANVWTTIGAEVSERGLDAGVLWVGLQLTGPDLSRSAQVYVESATVSYRRELDLQFGPIAFNLDEADSGAVALRIRHALDETVELWSRDPEGTVVRHLADAATKAEETSFRVAAVPGARYFAATRESASRPAIRAETPSELVPSRERVDYVMIAHRDFINPDLERLAEHRRRDGMAVRIIDVEDIYDEWNAGEVSPEAIRAFLEWTARAWPGGGPEYVLLVGDTSWDAHDRLKTGVVNRMPTVVDRRDPRHGTATDDALVEFPEEAHVPQFSTGRFSIQTPDELKFLVDKIIESETASPLGPWRARAVVAADLDHPYDDFQKATMELHEYSRSPLSGLVYDLSAFPYENHNVIQSKAPGARFLRSLSATDSLMDTVNQGTPFLQYMGHGGPPVWSKHQLMMGLDRPDSDVKRLRNDGRYPFVVSWSCLCGSFHHSEGPYDVCIAEEWQRQPRAGSIGMLAPTSGGSTSQHKRMAWSLSGALLHGEPMRLGDAVLASKIGFHTRWGSHLPRQMVYFGDPAARMVRPQRALDARLMWDPESAEPLTLVLRSPVELNGRVSVALLAGNADRYERQQEFAFEGDTVRLPLDPGWLAGGVRDKMAVYAWDDAQGIDAAATVRLWPDLRGSAREDADGSLAVQIENRGDIDWSALRVAAVVADGADGATGAESSETLALARGESREIRLAAPRTSGGITPVDVRLSLPGRDDAPQLLDRVHLYDASSASAVRLALGGITFRNGPLDGLTASQEHDLEFLCLAPEIPDGTQGRIYVFDGPGGALIGSSPIAFHPGLTQSNRIRWTPDAAGTRDLYVEVRDALDVTFATDTVTVTVAEAHDLVVEDAAVVSPPGPYGEAVLLEVTVANRGGSAARGLTFRGRELRDDGVEPISVMVLSLEPGALAAPLAPGQARRYRLAAHAFTTLANGRFELTAVCTEGLGRDTSESNSRAIIQIVETGDPDLHLHDLRWTPPAGALPPEAVLPVEAQVTNRGAGPALRSWVRFETRGETWGELMPIPALQPGQSCRVRGLLPVRQGLHVLRASADPFNALRESDENNNTAELVMDLTVVAPAAAVGWQRTDSAWVFDPGADGAWPATDRYRTRHGGRGLLIYEPGEEIRLPPWDQMVVASGGATAEDYTREGAALRLTSAAVYGRPDLDADPVRLRAPAEQGWFTPIVNVAFSSQGEYPRSAFRYRYGLDSAFRTVRRTSAGNYVADLSLEDVFLPHGRFEMDLDDTGDGWILSIWDVLRLRCSRGVLQTPVLDLMDSRDRRVQVDLEIPEYSSTPARIEVQTARTLQGLSESPWRNPLEDNRFPETRYLRWRAVFEGEQTGYAWLRQLTVEDAGSAVALGE